MPQAELKHEIVVQKDLSQSKELQNKQFQKGLKRELTNMPTLNTTVSAIRTITRSFHICSHQDW